MSDDFNPSQETRSSQGAPLKTVARFLIPALILVVGVYFGLKAFQDNEVQGPAAQAQQQGPRPSNVIVTPIESRSARDSHRVVGSLRAVSRAEVAARESGAVAEVLVDEGESVTRNDILVRLDPRRLEAQIAQAKANLTATRAMIAQREAEEERTGTDLIAKEQLFQRQAISEAELLDAQRESKVSASQGKSARDSLAAAGAALELLEVRREDLVIRAPFDARVVSRTIELGEWVQPGDSVFTLISEGRIEAWLQVPERFAGGISGEAVTLEIDGKSVSGTNLRVIPEADMSSRMLTVIADIEDPENLFVPGLSISANLSVGTDTPRLAVPSDAIVTTYAGPSLFRASPGEGEFPMAERLPVKVLFQQDGTVFIESDGLAEGDLIVTQGNERLFPGTPLMTKRAEEQPPADTPQRAIAEEDEAATSNEL